MARDSSGNHTLPAGNPISYGEKPASSSKYNAAMSDFSAEITDSLSRSGKGAMLANLAMGGFSITGAAAITATGTITGNLFAGSGASLTAVPATALTGTIDTARIAGSYTGITAVGTLTSLALSGAITGATTITASGVITNGTGQPSARVMNAATRTTAGAWTTYSSTNHNYTSSMNASTGVFTAPVAGRYFVTYRGNGSCTGGDGGVTTAIYVNGALANAAGGIVTQMNTAGSGNGYAESAVISLAVNDTVDIRVVTVAGSGTIALNCNEFSVCLLG
jgi:hypothetical protein